MNMQGGLAAALSGLALGVVEFGGVAWLVRRMQGRGASTAILWILRLLFVFVAGKDRRTILVEMNRVQIDFIDDLLVEPNGVVEHEKCLFPRCLMVRVGC